MQDTKVTTAVQTFLRETQRQIDEDGLLGISGTHFDRGHPISRVLEAKQYEAKVNSAMSTGKSKFSSKARIASELTNILSNMDTAKKVIGDCTTCGKFLIEGVDENHICPTIKDYADY